jgi:hypothetical protein
LIDHYKSDHEEAWGGLGMCSASGFPMTHPSLYLNHVFQVPHLQCSLRKIPKFCKILNLKITHFEKNYDQYFGLISDISILAWKKKQKTII